MGVKGNTVKKLSRVDMEEYVKIIKAFYKLHKFATLMADIMFVNGNAFMIASPRKLKFVTVEHIPSLTFKQLNEIIIKVIRIYGRGGFIIQMILMDMDF